MFYSWILFMDVDEEAVHFWRAGSSREARFDQPSRQAHFEPSSIRLWGRMRWIISLKSQQRRIFWYRTDRILAEIVRFGRAEDRGMDGGRAKKVYQGQKTGAGSLCWHASKGKGLHIASKHHWFVWSKMDGLWVAGQEFCRGLEGRCKANSWP